MESLKKWGGGGGECGCGVLIDLFPLVDTGKRHGSVHFSN